MRLRDWLVGERCKNSEFWRTTGRLDILMDVDQKVGCVWMKAAFGWKSPFLPLSFLEIA
jgi:hypothetical protein